jgi:hypothetical protein
MRVTALLVFSQQCRELGVIEKSRIRMVRDSSHGYIRVLAMMNLRHT